MNKDLPVAKPWFTIDEVETGVFMIVEPHCHRLVRANLFLIKGRDRDLLIDTGMGVANLREAIAPLVDKPLILFTTHAHIDHMGGHRPFADVEILVHPAEADWLREPRLRRGLSFDEFDPDQRRRLEAAGFDTTGYLIDAIPHPGYDVSAYRLAGVEPTRLVDEAAIVDIGSRRFEVLHLPGHSPGSIALWEASTGTLFAGDAIYDGILIDTTVGADIPAYLRTMARLRNLPVRIVHGGHKARFGRDRMIEIVDGYVESRRGAGE